MTNTITFYDDAETQLTLMIPRNIADKPRLAEQLKRALRKYFGGKISYIETREGHLINLYTILEIGEGSYRVVIHNPDLWPMITKFFCS